MSISKQHYYRLLADVHCPEKEIVINKVYELVKPHSEAIVTYFYKTMLVHPKAAHFINHDIVKRRLHASLMNWINLSLLYKYNDKMIEDYIEYQLQIGHVHGRIDLPSSFIEYGMFLLKSQVSNILKQSDLERNDLVDGLIIANQIFDISLALMNESYHGDLVFNEKEAQAFKLQYSTQNLAFDCERLRVCLANWMRELLLTIQQESFDVAHTITIRHSDFGLWVTHKAKLFLGKPEHETLINLLDNMDDNMILLINEFSRLDRRKVNLMTLNVLVSKALWILDDVAKQILDKDSGRDPLTRLFNRRYLETVLRHETECSLKNGLTYGLLVLDIDHFKKINDNFGHDNGDAVLAQLAEVLTNQVRAGDFVFRLGGEEFLVILGDVSEKILEKVANKIRKEVENSKITLKDETELQITISIGGAIHDGHPDFQRTLKQADESLYEAKRTGRNKVVLTKTPDTYAELANLV